MINFSRRRCRYRSLGFVFVVVVVLVSLSFNQPTNQSTNQAANQPTNSEVRSRVKPGRVLVRVWEGSGGVCWPIFTSNFKHGVAQKLRRVILLHIGLVTFIFLRIQNIFILMIWGNVHDSQSQLFLTFETQKISKKS